MIESSDGGEIETGFWGPDVSKIQLGELPPMATQQFVGYAVLALSSGVVPLLKPEIKEEWARDAQSLRDRVDNLPVLEIRGKYFAQTPDELASQLDSVDESNKGELFSTLAAAAVPIDEAVYYSKSPFIVQSDGKRVGFVHEGEVRHVVDSDDFYTLTQNVISGGIMGWSKQGTYQEVKDAAIQINSIFKT